MKQFVCSDGFEARIREMIASCFDKKAYFIQQLKERTQINYSSAEPLGMSVELKGLPLHYRQVLAPYGVSVRYPTSTPVHTFDTHIYICNHVSKKLLDEVVELLAVVV
jgi:hypothetical protein